MFFCGKRVIYLNCYEDNQKGEKAGFVRIPEEKGGCRIEFHLSRLRDWEDGNYQVVLKNPGEDFELGKIMLRQGEGNASWTVKIKDGNVQYKEKEVRAEGVWGIQIYGADGRTIRGTYKEKTAEPVGEKRKKSEKEEDIVSFAEKAEVVKAEKEEAEKAEEKADKKNEYTGKLQEERGKYKGITIEAEWVEDYEQDKWKQLGKIYSKVHPFGDQREFLTIEPKDFIILQAPYQRLVNNSFLLHGFYNYRHIILGLCSKAGGEKEYYLGVPGTFHEREKMVAVMFGFEGFECEGPVEIGKFGYYMRRVEL